MILLWVALSLFLLGWKFSWKIATSGWLIFGIYWGFQSFKFFSAEEPDYFNSFLSICMVFFCFILSRHIFRENETAKWVTKATCITSIIYFPFAEIPILNENIIGGTALLTAWFIHLLGTPTLVSSPKIFLLIENPLIIGVPKIEIILACTAIESIALFSGVILSVGAEKRRKTLALLATVPTIYGLNLIRNIYVAHAFAYTWYGTPEYSFYLAHHIISKAGSAIALIALAWITFRILPEVLEKISDTVNLVLGRG